MQLGFSLWFGWKQQNIFTRLFKMVSHDISITQNFAISWKYFMFRPKSFRHDIPYISAECGIRRNMSTCYSHKFQESLHKISTGQPSQTSDVPNPEKKNSTNQPVDILFQKNGHNFGFPFRVNYSKLELRISTIISKNKIQAKGFRMI